MRRTTIKIPDDLDTKLRAEATSRGITFSELVREAITAHLSGRRRLAGAGFFDSGRSDISERMEELLAQAYEDDYEASQKLREKATKRRTQQRHSA
ncbi:MAG: ribbon-helix-helix protein, CopG family [Micromonosporaceae bacterium]